MQRVFSGAQPTGTLHIGNYLGAVNNWVKLQDNYECIYSIVDLHSITVNYTSDQLIPQILKNLATYIACGIDPNKSIIFQQSSVPHHSELFWLLSCLTPIGNLNRMTQFKEKSGENKQKSSLGLYCYPVLQAADIMLYKANTVPIGEDQVQHLELTNDIIKFFNNRFNSKFFSPVKTIIGDNKRIMSLRDGTVKMSKSDSSEYSRINLTDTDDEINNKIKKSATDSYTTLCDELDKDLM